MGRKKDLSVRVTGLTALPPRARRPRLYQEAVRRAFETAGKRINGEVTVVFIERAKMLEINRRYLSHNSDTDVITFQHDAPRGLPAEGLPLGDICVSAWMVRRQARELGHSPCLEAAILATHGALHLLGHDDSHPRSKSRMFKIQDRIVASLRV